MREGKGRGKGERERGDENGRERERGRSCPTGRRESPKAEEGRGGIDISVESCYRAL